MLPLRAYLMVWQLDDGWSITVYRDLEPLAEAAKSIDFEQGHTGIIHVGFWRPEADSFTEIGTRFPGIILATSPAKDALPPPLATSSKAVCTVHGLGLFPILSGWGYETSEDKLGVASEWQRQVLFRNVEVTTDPIPLPFGQIETSAWVNTLSHINNEAYQACLACGIKDDESMFRFESSLPENLRCFLNVHRFRFLTGELPSASNVIDRLHLAGPSLLNAPLSNFELSVRATNVFSSAKISKISDIAERKTQGLYQLKNMGKKSVEEIATLLVNIWFPGYSAKYNTINNYGEFAISKEAIDISQSLECCDNAKTSNFIETLEGLIDKLSINRQEILRSRMGYRCEQMILEDLGKKLGITRERVRQLESDAIRFLRKNEFFKKDLVPRLLGFLDNRHAPLPLFGLEVLDPWFSGVAEIGCAFKWVLDHCCESEFEIINHNGQNYVTTISQEDWEKTIDQSLSILATQASLRISKSQARNLVAGMLIGRGEELRDELWDAVLPTLNFSSLEGAEDVLVNVGNKWTSVVEAVLVESPIPLHMNEITAKIHERTGRQIEANLLRKILNNIGYLFGRGTYGLRKHLEMTDQELDTICAEVEEIILASDPQRQWHASELYSYLSDIDPEIYDRSNPHIIGIALQKSQSLVSLGRMVWAIKQSTVNGSASRIDIHQAIVSLLQNEGRPMTAVEIRQRLQRDRGLNSIFQIVMEDELIRVGRGVWGLLPRDVPYSAEEMELIVEQLIIILNKHQRGIHYSVLLEESSKYLPCINLNVDPSLIQSIALRSGLMKVDMSQYLYLPEWGSSRWPSNTEVLAQIIASNPTGGWTIAAILPKAEEILGRPLESSYIHKAIEGLGGSYDLDSKKWYFMAEAVAGISEDD